MLASWTQFFHGIKGQEFIGFATQHVQDVVNKCAPHCGFGILFRLL
jgi:hypothetical protein